MRRVYYIIAFGIGVMVSCTRPSEGSSSSGDAEPPEVRITYPQEGDTVPQGVIKIKAEANDNIGVQEVRFYVDENLVGTDYEPPYEVDWDATEGSHSAYAQAVDFSENIGTSSSVDFVVLKTHDVAYGSNTNTYWISDTSWTLVEVDISGFDGWLTDSVKVHFRIYHDFLSDLFITLNGPTGFFNREDTLVYYDLPSGPGWVDTTMVSHRFPDEPVSGTWQLWIFDGALADEGYINLFEIWIYCHLPVGKKESIIVRRVRLTSRPPARMKSKK